MRNKTLRLSDGYLGLGLLDQQARGVLDSLLLHGFMKATAVAAKGALDAAKSDDAELRGKKIKEAREKLAGAMKYKAPAEFKGQCERLLEVAMFSGGVKAKGPTKAKPLDTAPKPENRAKGHDETPHPPARPTGGIDGGKSRAPG